MKAFRPTDVDDRSIELDGNSVRIGRILRAALARSLEREREAKDQLAILRARLADHVYSQSEGQP